MTGRSVGGGTKLIILNHLTSSPATMNILRQCYLSEYIKVYRRFMTEFYHPSLRPPTPTQPPHTSPFPCSHLPHCQTPSTNNLPCSLTASTKHVTSPLQTPITYHFPSTLYRLHTTGELSVLFKAPSCHTYSPQITSIPYRPPPHNTSNSHLQSPTTYNFPFHTSPPPYNR